MSRLSGQIAQLRTDIATVNKDIGTITLEKNEQQRLADYYEQRILYIGAHGQEQITSKRIRDIDQKINTLNSSKEYYTTQKTNLEQKNNELSVQKGDLMTVPVQDTA